MNQTPTALVADDEEAPREQLLAALRQAWPALRIVAVAHHGADAWDAFLEHEPDICFLDIRMPGFSGIEVAQRIGDTAGPRAGPAAGLAAPAPAAPAAPAAAVAPAAAPARPQIVFVSAYGDHALAAFDAGAVDYLLKPVEATRLAQTVQRLQARQGAMQTDPAMQALLDTLAAQLRRPAPLTVLQAAVGREVRLIRSDDVIYFESDSRYTRVVFDSEAGKGEALIRTPLKELLARLDGSQFWQVHRSVVVAHRHIAAAVRVDEGQMHLTLRGRPEKLPVSRHFQGLFKGQ